MASSSLVKKLHIKPDQRMAVVNPPAGYLQELGSLPQGVELSTQLDGQFDVVQLFVQDRAQLEKLFPAALRALKEDGLFWIAYPKQSARIETDLNRDEGWQAVYKAGLRAVAMVAIDDIWSAVRFRPDQPLSEQEIVDAQYGGKKASLRPIYEALITAAQESGPDVELAPRKSYVGLVRNKIFAVIAPSTSARLDLGLKLPGKEQGVRLAEARGFGSGSITHKVALTSVEDVDDEVVGWLREAYKSVG